MIIIIITINLNCYSERYDSNNSESINIILIDNVESLCSTKMHHPWAINRVLCSRC